jgi:uncharacterized protein
MEMLQKCALVFTIVGALNWGLIGLFNFNLVSTIFTVTALQNIIYVIVGVCGLINIGILFSDFEK